MNQAGYGKIAGTKQVCRAAKLGKLHKIILASDVDEYIRRKILQDCAQVEVIDGPTMLELGRQCGIDIGTAVIGLLKDVPTEQEGQ